MVQKVLYLENIKDYLEDVKKHLSFKINKIKKIKELSGGNVSYVFAVEIESDSGINKLVLKQVLSQIKREDEDIEMPLERIITEAKVLEKIKEWIGENFVPEIFYLDKENFVLIMSDVEQDRKCLVDELEKNNLHANLAKQFGEFFGRFHARTYKIDEDLSTAERELMETYYIPLHLTWGARKHFPEEVIKKIVKESYLTNPSLIWIDPVHRNIFVSKNDFRLIDFEFCLHLDPAIDLGIFLSHWFIKSQEADDDIKQGSKKFIDDFIEEYKKVWLGHVSDSADHLGGIIKRSNKWLGIYLLSRVDGKHGSYVKDKEVEEKVRNLGKDLLNNKELIK